MYSDILYHIGYGLCLLKIWIGLFLYIFT